MHLHEPFVPWLGPAFLREASRQDRHVSRPRTGPHWPYITILPLVRFWNRRLDGRVAVSDAHARRLTGTSRPR
jgi:hypothetical protein